MAAFSVRPVVATDESALISLAQVTDGGAVTFNRRYRVSPLEAAADDSAGFVAETQAGEVIGAAWVSFGICKLRGSPQRYALLHSLAVAPAYRRRGVAGALTRERLAMVDAEGARNNEVIVVMATIQNGNVASMVNARRWATTVTGPLRVTPVPVRRQRPRLEARWQITTHGEGSALDDDPGLALAPDLTRASVQRWLDTSVRGQRVNHLHLLTDDSGVTLAALGIHDDTPVTELKVTDMPRSVALANRFVRVVDRDGVMRTGQLALRWQRDAVAGRYLWQHIRWHWRDRLTSIITTVDPTDPIASMTAAPRWYPVTTVRLAIWLPGDLQELSGPIRLPL